MTGNPIMRTKRNFWPFGIILSFALFLAGTVGLVVMAARNPNDLVSANYYDAEVRFQTQIDQINRARRLPEQTNVHYDSARQRIVIAMPVDHSGGAIKGRVELFRPSAARFDEGLELNPDACGVQLIDTSRLVSGLWMVKIVWSVNGQTYRHEQKLVIGGRHL